MIRLPHPSSARNLPDRRRAMTLVEVLVATVILGMGVAGLMSAASLSLRNQQRSERRAAALGLAQAKLAEVELIGPHVWMLARPLSDTEELAGTAYQWSLSIEQQPVGELFVVRVQVGWPDPGGGSVEVETWLNDYEAATSGAGGFSDSGTPGATR